MSGSYVLAGIIVCGAAYLIVSRLDKWSARQEWREHHGAKKHWFTRLVDKSDEWGR